MVPASAEQEGGHDLLGLQSRMKCDPLGYEDELLLQLRHFEACLRVFQLNFPSKSVPSSFVNDQSGAKELADMAMFLAHVSPFYPQHLRQFPQQLLGLLRSSGESLQPALRRHLTQALILLRNRQMIELIEMLPVLMELQTFGDRAVRKLAFLHIVQDVRRMNLKHRNESKNRQLQNVLFKLLQDTNERRSIRPLIVLCELHRRKLWDDERTANAICAACFHPSSKMLKAALGFLLGYEKMDEEDADSSEEDEEHKPVVALSREAVYKAHHKGTFSSRRKKQAKLDRVIRSLKKHQRIQAEGALGSSPLQRLHDPQCFAEKLFSRLQTSNERFEVKLMMMKVISRTIGLHRLIVLNFYPFLQKYVQPHQHEITHVLAAAAQACHDMVPPDAVESLLRQVVNTFVHDRARPEIIAVGLNVVREMCMRMPLVMTRELLTDLVLYKKSRDKAVSAAARSLVTIFRQLYPSLLEKRDRGKGADLSAKPKAFGEKMVENDVPGIDLLLQDDNEQSDESQSYENVISDSDDEKENLESNMKELGSSSEDEEFCDEDGVEEAFDSDTHSCGSENDEASPSARECGNEKDLKRKRVEEETELIFKRNKSERQDAENQNCSLRGLKKLMNQIQDDKVSSENWQQFDGILSDLDFQRLRELQAQKAARDELANVGIGKSKRKDEPVKFRSSEYINERRVNPATLEVKVHKRREKEERLASVRAGQEDRQSYKARTAVKQKKTGGLSNRQKEKKKSLPLAAKLAKASKSRMQKNGKKRFTKQFRGKKAWKT